MTKGNVDKGAVKAIQRLAWCQSFDKTCVDDMLSDGYSYDEIKQELYDSLATLRAMLESVSDEIEETGTAIDYLRHKKDN